MDMKTKAVEEIAGELATLGCEYMIVQDTGNCFKRGNFKHIKGLPRGVVAGYVDPFIDPLEPGMAVAIPAGDYPLDLVARTASTRAFIKFGKGNFVTQKDADKNTVEVLCLSMQTEDEPEYVEE